MIPQKVISQFAPIVLKAYDFSKANYTQALIRITGIQCHMHGEFSQYSAQLRKEKGAHCPACGEEARKAKRYTPEEEFIQRAITVHGGKYTYVGVGFVKMNSPITITCPEHGAFVNSANKHIYSKQGCPVCAVSTRGHRKMDEAESNKRSAAAKIQNNAATFIARATEVHKDKYDYSESVYTGAKQKLSIICKTHGAFTQVAWNHVDRGYGCPQCSHHLSKQEQRIAEYLAIFTPVVQRDRTIIAPKELDIYLPEHKIAVEYSGMYWHAHFTKEEEQKNKLDHYNKYMQCKALGIRLITIYESEWNQREPQIRRLLRNAIGKSKGKLMARKCEVRNVPTADAKVFYEKYHPQGGNGGGHHYGLYWKGVLTACMRFAYGNNDRGAGAKNKSWTLGRYATRVTVSGAASRLFKAFLDDKTPTEVKSFSDNRYFGGGMYEQLGFLLEENVAPDYQVWSPRVDLQSKPHYQRRNIPTRLKEHEIEDTFDPATDTRTEAEMTYLMGCGRIYDCGKKRWVWKLSA